MKPLAASADAESFVEQSAGRGAKTVRWTVFAWGNPRRGFPLCRATSEANKKHSARWTVCHLHFGRRRRPSQNDAGKNNLSAESARIVEPSPGVPLFAERRARQTKSTPPGGQFVISISGEGVSLRKTMPAKTICPQKVRASLNPRRGFPICRAMSEANKKHSARWTVCHLHFGRRRKPSQNDAAKNNLPAESTRIVEPAREGVP